MTEKQRWLMKDLEAWRERQMNAIGRYGPKSETPEPAHVKAARVAHRKAEKVIARWGHEKRKPWDRQCAAIQEKVNAVRRVILFEKTEVALKAIRMLR